MENKSGLMKRKMEEKEEEETFKKWRLCSSGGKKVEGRHASPQLAIGRWCESRLPQRQIDGLPVFS